MSPSIPTLIAIAYDVLRQAVAVGSESRSWTAWQLLRATVRLTATTLGIIREPSYVVVRIHARPDEGAPAYGERAA